MKPEDLKAVYQKAKDDRDRHTDNILASKAQRIVVVAGPGTGKTTLFSKLLQKRGGGGLTLSFINALVDDLSLGLYGLSDVKTLHGFSAGVLRDHLGAKIYPRLTEVIREDAAVLLGEKGVDFENFFQNLESDEKYIPFYKERKNYYGKYYGFSDAVYGLVKYLESKKDRIPTYNQVVVDEFQDFNKAEVALIQLLAEKNPILIAGDDDQSLYMELKDASPDHIRVKHGAGSPDYEAFPLPFCSRSTEVIVSAVNDIVEHASANGLLKNRVSKPYLYFPSEPKDKESAAYPSITYTQQYEGEMATFIQKEISSIAERERDKFSVLIVMPPQLRKTAMPKFVKALTKCGFRNLIYPTAIADKQPVLIDGLKIILGNPNDNLGWRIVAKRKMSDEDFASMLKTAVGTTRIVDLIDGELRKQVKQLVRTLKKVRDGKVVAEELLKEFIEAVGYEPYQLAEKRLKEELLDDEPAGYGIPRGIRNIPITLTTIPSSKGLAADYVYLTHFDDQYYTSGGKGTISDKEVFSFLVALTRARKKAYLLSSRDQKPTLLSWIDPVRIEEKLASPHKLRAKKIADAGNT